MASSQGFTVVSFLGATLDRGAGRKRWDHWRPNVGMCQHSDLLVRRLLLLVERRYEKLYQQVVEDIALVSPETVVERREIALKNAWDFEEVFDVLFEEARALAIDPEREDLLVHMTTGTHVEQICLFLLCESRHFPGRLLQTGPSATGRDPHGMWQIIDLDLSRFDRLAQRFAEEHRQGESVLKSGIATQNVAFNRLIAQIERVAPKSSAPMLLMGPTGAGKSHLARQIYELKKQRHQIAGPFVEVNCATLSGATAHSTLFGHTKGAFTGAQAERAGLLRMANRGLLFLDEVGELGLDEQAMLLRAMEEHRFFPLGSDHEVESDFQLIAGTNADLRDAVRRGAFREDLLARINLWTFRLPGLRERIEDLEPNLDYELERFSDQVGRRVHFSSEARRLYLDFATARSSPWKGNFRDLNASVTRLCTLAQAGRITEADVKEEIERLHTDWGHEATTTTHALMQDPLLAAADDDLLGEVLGPARMQEIDRFDRVQLAAVLRVCQRAPSLAAAGRELFQVSRLARATTNDADRLRKYLARFGIRASELHQR